MLEYLLILLLLRYRDAFTPRAANDDDAAAGLKPYAGLHYEGETEYLRRVK